MHNKPFNAEDDPVYKRVTEQMREHLTQMEREQAIEFSEKRARMISLVSSQLADQTAFNTVLAFVRQHEAGPPKDAG